MYSQSGAYEMTCKEKMTNILHRYKCLNAKDYLVQIPVLDMSEKIICYLRPITADYKITIPQCARIMGKWRMENPSMALGTFEITDERTDKWLINSVIQNDERILFLIANFAGEFMGHIGLGAINPLTRSAEIDSVMRGEMGIPGLMHYCMSSIIEWGQTELGLSNFSLEVFSDNDHAVKFYERCGFIRDRLIPLQKVMLPDEIRWQVDETLAVENAERLFLHMIYTGNHTC